MNEVQQDLALAALENYFKTKNHAALVRFWQLYPKPIPAWHIKMMNDKSRNDFYRQEIINQASGKIVMDLGCGSGLLTQMSLEAGARHIYAVEMDPVLQKCIEHTFKDEIAKGLVTLLAKNSKDLVSSDFVHGEPELVIHEIFGQALFNERVIPVFGDLFSRNVVHTKMNFIPQKFSLWGKLNNRDAQTKILDPQYTDKFWYLENISFFGTQVPPGSAESPKVDVSEAFEIFSIDLKDLKTMYEFEGSLMATEEGNSVRLWFNLHGEKSTLTTDITVNEQNHWGNSSYFLRFSPGQVNIKASYNNEKFLIYSTKK